MLYNVYAVNIETKARRIMAENKTDDNAEAIIMMAVKRRGVDTEYYTKEEIKNAQV